MVSEHKEVNELLPENVLVKDLPPVSPLFDKKPRVLLVKGGWRASWHYEGMHFMFDAESLPEVIDLWNGFVNVYIYGLDKVANSLEKVIGKYREASK